jgi:hypothetical protein
MKIENPMRLARELKGVPITILFILRLAGHPVKIDYLMTITDWDDKTIRKALKYMQEVGLVRQLKDYGPWTIADGAEQLPLGFGDEADDPEIPEYFRTSGEEKSGNIPDFIDASPKELPELTENSQKSGNIPDSDPLVVNSSNSLNSINQVNLLLARENREKIAAVIDEFKIHNPHRKKILQMDGLSPGKVEALCRAAETTGQAIYWIENYWDVPKVCDDCGKAKCICTPQQIEERERRSYITGKFADFIEH